MTNRFLSLCLTMLGVFGVACAQVRASGQSGASQLMPAAAEQLMALANQARAQNGAGKLVWDESLAAAARQHCLRMAAEGPISHRYGGEPDVAARAGQAGAHFDLIEENVAVGPTASEIHSEWMDSPGHRTNLLSPDVNRVGIAVVAARGVLYATADYSRSVQALTREQVEARVGELLRSNGIFTLRNNAQARAACLTDHGVPPSPEGLTAGFVMRWQSSDLNRLPEALTERLASRRYRQAAVGSCPAQGVEGNFTAYRVAVLLY
jgi:Cysteine-rich secretory protein family